MGLFFGGFVHIVRTYPFEDIDTFSLFKEEYGERGFEEQEMLKVKDIKAKLQTQDNGRQLQNDYLTIQFIQRV